MSALGTLHPGFRPYAAALVAVAERYGLNPRVTSTRRSFDDQRRLYERWKSGRNPYPAAAPGCSQHNYGVAFDMVVDDPQWLGAVWQHWGGYWGGSRDPVHFGITSFPC